MSQDYCYFYLVETKVATTVPPTMTTQPNAAKEIAEAPAVPVSKSFQYSLAM